MFMLNENQIKDIFNGKILSIDELRFNKIDDDIAKEMLLIINSEQDILDFINNSKGISYRGREGVSIELLGISKQMVELEVDIKEFIDNVSIDNLSIDYYKCSDSNDIYVILKRVLDKYSSISVSFYLSDLDIYDEIEVENKMIICNKVEVAK